MKTHSLVTVPIARFAVLATVMLLLGGFTRPSLAEESCHSSAQALCSEDSGPLPVAAQPNLSAKKTFVATPPYSVLVNGVEQNVQLYDAPRTYDFVGNPFSDPNTGLPDIAAMMSWRSDPAEPLTQRGSGITAAGKPGHIEKLDSRSLMLAVVAGDEPSTWKVCKSQITSYAVPSRQKVFWDYIVQFGSHPKNPELDPEKQPKWDLTAPGTHPVMISQLKPSNFTGYTPLSIYVDTDTRHRSKLLLSFTMRKGVQPAKLTNVGKAHNLERYVPVRIVQEAFLDEREIADGGQGYWRVWVNGALVVNEIGPTLAATSGLPADPSQPVTTPHQLSLSSYPYNDPYTDKPCPNEFNRYTYWYRAKMLVD